MDKELARVTAKLFSESVERTLVGTQMLKAHGLFPCDTERFAGVLLCEVDMKLDCLAEALGESVVLITESETDEWWGFWHDGVKYYTIRRKEKKDGNE